jgi:hypothetical protein
LQISRNPAVKLNLVVARLKGNRTGASLGVLDEAGLLHLTAECPFANGFKALAQK